MNIRKHSWLLHNSSSDLFNKIRDRCIEKNDDSFRVLIEFSQTVMAYHNKKITFYQADQIFKYLFKHDPDLFIESNRVLAQSLEKPRERTESLRNDDNKSTNDEDHCSLYEKTLNVKEFYMFEMDLAFSRLVSTIEKLEKNADRLEECLTVLDFTCIKKLYNDRDRSFGEAMVEILKSDPVGRLVARVIVVERLREKKAQLEEQKLHLDRIWNEIFEDIREKGRVYRHREFLRRTKEASINGYKE